MGEYLSTTFGLIGKAALPLLPLLIAVAVPIVVSFVAADAALGLTEWTDELLREASNPNPDGTFDFPTLDASESEVVTWAAIVVLVNVLGSLFVAIAGAVTLWSVRQGREPAAADILAESGRAALPLLGLGLTVLGLSVAAVALLVLLVVAAAPLAVLAILAAIPLSFILFARLGLAVPVAVAERRGASALKRSWNLTSGVGAGVLGRLLLFSLLLGLAVQLASAPTSFLGAFGTAAIAIGTVLSALLSLASAAAWQAGAVVLYGDLVDQESVGSAPAGSPGAQLGWGQQI